MSKHDDQFLEELKGLKTMSSMDPTKKEEMRMTIAKHAKKKRVQQKRKRQFVWVATAAAILLFGIVAATMINQQNMTVDEPGTPPGNEQPAQGEDPETNEDPVEEEQPVEEEEERNLEVTVDGPFNDSIVVEGMEEPTTVKEFNITSHNISYRMDDFVGNYEIDDNKIIHKSDASNVMITVEIMEGFSIDELDGDHTPLDTEENSFEGVMHHESGERVTGYYAYQIDQDILYMEFEYDISTGDGVNPRFKLLRESIKEIE